MPKSNVPKTMPGNADRCDGEPKDAGIFSDVFGFARKAGDLIQQVSHVGENPNNTISNNHPQAPTRDDDGGNTLEAGTPNATNDVQYVTGRSLGALVVTLSVVVFLIFLDASIISTAIPHITDDFHSVQDVGCYISSYQLTNAIFQPLAGKVYQRFNAKTWFIVFLLVFEAGSLTCGVAGSSALLVAGRAIAGMGAAGITNGALTIVAYAAPLNKRPSLTGSIMGLGQVGLALGPLLGGVFTSYVSWRWCFYINLPVGALASAILSQIRVPGQASKPTPWIVIRTLHWDLDLVGFVLLVGAAVQLLLAIQFGSATHPWNSATVLGLFCGALVTFLFWAVWNKACKNQGLIPMSILKKIPVWGAALTQLCLLTTVFCASFFLPLYFQAVRGVSPIQSGVDVLPSILTQVFTLMLASRLVELTGYVVPFAIVAGGVGIISNYLYSTLHVDTPIARWVGFQVLNGFGRGVGMPMPVLAVQLAVPPPDIPIALSFVTFVSSLGTALILACAGLIFNTYFGCALSNRGMGDDIGAIMAAGATRFRDIISEDKISGVVLAYVSGIKQVFFFACLFAGLGSVAACGKEPPVATQGST
ncbi:hypothetical protein VTI74DRAFT_11196 [Chaetomium olivicolor]